MIKNLSNNRNLFIIAVIALVNALGYGIIIPILYSYSQRFGLSDFQNGLLFALFSFCSFLSTPIIGRLSDKYGRKPLLLSSITGTAISFLLMAFAPNAIFLFLARALDGITAGNIPVASAVISDTTTHEERARGFAIMGASFGFGFVFGPAISALTLRFGHGVPFLIAAGISIIAVILTFFFLPETNQHIGEVKHGKLFDFKKLVNMLFDNKVGLTLTISLIYSLAIGMFIFAFQPFSVKIIKLTPDLLAVTFTIFGIIGLITQVLLLPRIVRSFGEVRAFKMSLLLTSITYFGMALSRTLPVYLLATVFSGFSNSFAQPLTQTILSRETDVKSQGTILGLNASYVSIGNTVGPIIAGFLATFYLPLPIMICSLLILGCFFLAFRIIITKSVEHTF